MGSIQDNTTKISIMKTIREAILYVVNNQQGIKGVELSIQVITKLHPILFTHRNFEIELNKLIAEGEIVECEYTLPNIEYRIKSMYFPKGTTFGHEQSHNTTSNA
jgi:hypothetical protein